MFFAIEVILSCIGYEDPKYLGSFFFYLDVVSTASLLADIEPIIDAITGPGDEDDAGSGNVGTIARASRGAKLGSKAGRLTRVIRIIRLIRIVKLYKSA